MATERVADPLLNAAKGPAGLSALLNRWCKSSRTTNRSGHRRLPGNVVSLLFGAGACAPDGPTLHAKLFRRRAARGWTVVTLLLVVGSISLAACSSGQGSSSGTSPAKHFPSQIALFGDSLAWEAQPYWTELIHKDHEAALTFDTFGGTATCDWLGRMREVESEYHPKEVQLSFSGNNLTPCMKGYELYTKAYYDKYRADTLTAIGIFNSGRTHVYLIGAPITQQQQSVPNWQMLNMVYAEIAQADPARVTYVDAGRSVEGPDGTFAQTLPCLKGESCTGPTVDGTPSNIVRSSDGIHFCPSKEGNVGGVIGGCPVYSSGAFRFARAMAAPLAPLNK
jgi:hypothetical protein